MTSQSLSGLAAELSILLEELGLEAGSTQKQGLLNFLAILQRWNAHYNLTAIRAPEAMLRQHLADCLAVITPLTRQCGNGSMRLLDVGSGGGLPGVVIAIMKPDCKVTCVDSVGKKAAFIQQVAGELQLGNLRAQHSRVEDLNVTERFDVVTSRAFASLTEFTRVTSRYLSDDGVWLAMKGRRPENEIGSIPPTVTVFHVEQLQVPGLEAERCIVWMRAQAR